MAYMGLKLRLSRFRLVSVTVDEPVPATFRDQSRRDTVRSALCRTEAHENLLIFLGNLDLTGPLPFRLMVLVVGNAIKRPRSGNIRDTNSGANSPPAPSKPVEYEEHHSEDCGPCHRPEDDLWQTQVSGITRYGHEKARANSYGTGNRSREEGYVHTDLGSAVTND
nr:hypothetical protein [Tropicimonas sp. IMCC34043]